MKLSTSLVLSVLALVPGCKRELPANPPPKPEGTFAIPRARGPIKIDGKCGDESWRYAFRSPPFVDSHGHATPHGELRATADDENLYLEVYAADVDIRSHGDVVKLDVGSIHVELTPVGATAPAGVRTAVDTDDLIDDAKGNDEEWVNEVAIPWSLLGSHDVPVRAFRIDVGHNEPPHGMAWPRYAPAMLSFRPDAR